MKKNPDSFWLPVLRSVLQGIINLFNVIKRFGERYPSVNQNIQLTVMYYFAFIDLVYSILNLVYALGGFPRILEPFVPLIKWILLSPTVQFWLSPERSFILSYFILETIIVRSMFGVSLLVRFNIVMLFSLLMLQGLIISYWDTLFNKELSNIDILFTFDEESTAVIIDDNVGIPVLMMTFLTFLMLYIALYVSSLQGKYLAGPGLNWVTDSACFWLKIRTPTMKFGRKKRKGKRKG